MKKTQILPDVRLVPEAMAKLDKHLTSAGGIFSSPCSRFLKATFPGNITWRFDEFGDLLARYPQSLVATYRRTNGVQDVFIENFVNDRESGTYITVSAPDRATIDGIFAIIEEYRAQSTNPAVRKPHQRNRAN